MRAVSLKRQAENREFAKVREFVMERDGGICQLAFALELRCLGPIDPHHVVPVARDVTLRLDPANLKCLCRHLS